GETDAGSELRQQDRLRRRHLGQLAAEEHVDAIGAFRKHTLARAIGPLFISGQSTDVFRPALHHVIGSGEILRTKRSWNCGKACSRFRLSLDRRPPIGDLKTDPHADRQDHNHQSKFSHVILRKPNRPTVIVNPLRVNVFTAPLQLSGASYGCGQGGIPAKSTSIRPAPSRSLRPSRRKSGVRWPPSWCKGLGYPQILS